LLCSAVPSRVFVARLRRRDGHRWSRRLDTVGPTDAVARLAEPSRTTSRYSDAHPAGLVTSDRSTVRKRNRRATTSPSPDRRRAACVSTVSFFGSCDTRCSAACKSSPPGVEHFASGPRTQLAIPRRRCGSSTLRGAAAHARADPQNESSHATVFIVAPLCCVGGWDVGRDDSITKSTKRAQHLISCPSCFATLPVV
jgi:hypothetical protein